MEYIGLTQDLWFRIYHSPFVTSLGCYQNYQPLPEPGYPGQPGQRGANGIALGLYKQQSPGCIRCPMGPPGLPGRMGYPGEQVRTITLL